MRAIFISKQQLYSYSSGFPILAQEETDWQVAAPRRRLGCFKNVTFTTDEGTWMNLDVSPDGNTIVFDMLGDIYSLPVSGGKATPLRTGLPFFFFF